MFPAGRCAISEERMKNMQKKSHKQSDNHSKSPQKQRHTHKSNASRTATALHPAVTALLLLAAFCACLFCFLYSRNHPVQTTAGGSYPEDSASSTPSANARRTPGPVTEYIRASDLTTEQDSSPTGTANPCSDLSVPTYLTRVDDTYFLVDCYHNQVIYNDNLTDPLYEWKVMTNEIDKGHTLASDGTVYLVDDTERHRILVFEKEDDLYLHTQTFEDIGNRPHYIIYDAPTDTFYAWSSMSGEMYLFRHNPGETRMYLTEIRRIEALDNIYVRSFTIVNDEIYFVSGNSSIIRAALADFRILETYPVPDSMAGMIQITPIQDYFYITVSTDLAGSQDYATILRTRDLSALVEGDYEDIYSQFIGGGTPYYITALDNMYYLTEHRLPGHSLWRFRVEENILKDIETVY